MNKTKKAIFDSAVQIFSKNGYHSATVDEVAINAGVAKGTLYYHFKSKEDLFNFIVTEGINLIDDKVKEATKNLTDPLEKIEASAKVQLKYVYENKDLFRVIMSQIWGNKDIHIEMREQIKHIINISSKGVDELITEGYISDDNSEVLSYCFIGILFSSALYEILNEDQYNHDEIIDKFMSYIRYGLKINKEKLEI